MPGTPRCNIRLEPSDLTVEALATLDTREQRVIALRYGANGFSPHSCKEVARIVGFSYVTVSAIAARGAHQLLALRKLREPVETEIVCANVPVDGFPGVGGYGRTGTKVYRLTVDVVVDIGDRDGGYWALRGIGEPKLEEVRCGKTG